MLTFPWGPDHLLLTLQELGKGPSCRNVDKEEVVGNIENAGWLAVLLQVVCGKSYGKCEILRQEAEPVDQRFPQYKNIARIEAGNEENPEIS